MRRGSAVIVFVCMSMHAFAEPPRDALSALEDVRTGAPPWLAGLADCHDAAARAAGPFVPFECFPPAAATIGFSAIVGEVASFESERDPGCGETLPRRLERRVPGRPRATRSVPIHEDGGAIPEALARAVRESLVLVSLGFAPPVGAIAREARLVSGARTTRPAVVLGPPLEGWALYLDDVRREVALVGADGEPVRLARLPAPTRGLTSIWDVAVSPDARWIILRLATIEGTPCDPAALERHDLEVPERVRASPLGTRVRWSGDEQRCLAAGERAACEARCADRPDRCGALARLVHADDPDRAIALFERACEAGDGASCEARVAARPPGEAIAIKGGTPPWVARWSARVRRGLVGACDAGDVGACARLLDRHDEPTWWRPTRNEARRARTQALRLLEAACARSAPRCPELAAMRARRAP